MSNRTISPLGLAQIEAHEGFWPEAVALGGGRYVVGFGHVCETRPAFTMTKQEAAALLVADLAPAEAAVNHMCGRPLTQSQFDALVSFTFSVGVEAFSRSDVLRRVRSGEFAAAACAMEAWRRSRVAGGDGAVYEALVRRRAAEKALLLNEFEAAPSAWIKPELDHAAAILGAPLMFPPLPQFKAEAADETPQPANDSEPLMLTHQVVSAVPAIPTQHEYKTISLKAPKKRMPPIEQIAFGVLAVMGLAMVVAAGVAMTGRPSETGGLSATLLLGAPGVAATLAGLYFLTRRSRPVFAPV